MAPVPGARDAILEAALAVFRENGYERTSVRAIAERADISISSLYAHIKGKQELFLELVAPVFEHARADMAEIVASGAPVREKLRRAIVRGTSAFDENYEELVIYLRDFFPILQRADPEARREYERSWIALIEQGIEEGVLRADVDPKMAAYGILGMINWMHQWYRPGGRFSAAEIGEQYATSWIDGLSARS
jgi:TetR/AcrR family transcriptional regulator, cholesterol catabolism regulator